MCQLNGVGSLNDALPLGGWGRGGGGSLGSVRLLYADSLNCVSSLRLIVATASLCSCYSSPSPSPSWSDDLCSNSMEFGDWDRRKRTSSSIFLDVVVVSQWEEECLNYRPGNGPKLRDKEKVAIVEKFQIMNLWSVCLIDKSLQISLWLHQYWLCSPTGGRRD